MYTQFCRSHNFMIDPTYSSLCVILREGRPCIFVVDFQVQHVGHVHHFFFVQWPHNNNFMETKVSLDILLVGKIWVVHHIPRSLCCVLTFNFLEITFQHSLFGFRYFEQKFVFFGLFIQSDRHYKTIHVACDPCIIVTSSIKCWHLPSITC